MYSIWFCASLPLIIWLCCNVNLHFYLFLSFCCPHPRPPPISTRFPGCWANTMFSLCKITRLIKANKQTTALRQLQMKANLYTINSRRSSFNLPLRPAHCSPPPLATSPPFTPPSPVGAPYLRPALVLLGWAQRQGKLTDASIIHRSPLLSFSLSVYSFARSASLCTALR